MGDREINTDVLIIGGGIIGLSAANLLAKQKLKVTLIEKNEFNFDLSPRYYALNLAAKRLFEKLNIWDKLKVHANAYPEMYVYEANGFGEIHFHANDYNIESLGYVLNSALVIKELYDAAKYLDVEIIIDDFQFENGQFMTKNKKISPKLIIAADGKFSKMRQTFNIDVDKKDYQQDAIVANVEVQKENYTAVQRFLKDEIIAFLPISKHLCSIVLSTKRKDFLMSLSDEDFAKELDIISDGFLKKTKLKSKRFCFPLEMQIAKTFYAQNCILIGDAAHVVHPLAGQGTNLGIKDILLLNDLIENALNKGMNINSESILSKYSGERRCDCLIMAKSFSGIYNLFNSENFLLKTARSFGLNITDKFSFLKKGFVKVALGV